jgi:putative endonuclease
MYFVYILFSQKCNRYYIGFSADVTARITRHNNGTVPATRNCLPYILCAYKTFENEAEARKEELRIKKQKSRIYTESLITGDWPTSSNGLP